MAENPTGREENISDPAAESLGKTKPSANAAITAGAPVLVAAAQEVGETAPLSLN